MQQDDALNDSEPGDDDDSPTEESDTEASVVLLLQKRPTDPAITRAARASFDDRYRERSVLGGGGMGDVRLCRDLYIGRDVALKTLQAHAAQRSDLRARFEREARVQGQLEHPSIVPVYDLGHGDAGVEYFTMKRVRGHTLKQILRGKRRGEREFEQLTQRKLLGAFNQACLAVAFAHARGVIHRDLKPANLMLGDFGEVYVLDWGIAKVRDESDVEPVAFVASTERGDATGGGGVLGTPGYMSPEMVRGEYDTLDERSDVYALGAILFAIVTHRPFNDAATPPERLRKTLDGIDARPSRRFPGVVEVAPELEAICVRATAFRREDRYPSVREMVEEIERYLDGDRDTQRRRELAAEHVSAARAALSSGRDELSARAEAMREVNRALALHPNDRDALSTMLHLVTEPPKVAPPEIEAELEAAIVADRRTTARAGAAVYALWVVMLPVLMAMGVRSYGAWTTAIALTFGAAVSALYAGTRKGPDSTIPGFVVALVSSAAIAAGSMIFSPLMFVPAIALSNSMVIALHTPPGVRRGLVVAMGICAVLVPAVLEELAILPRSMLIAADAITIIPRMVSFSRVPTLIFCGLAYAGLIILPTLLVAHVRDARRTAERKVLLQLWHLRQLVPESDST